MELKFNDAKAIRPRHLERCLCWDKFEKGYRCYVYDDISKYWCTQATTEHDVDGDNHIVDYADYQVTKWASIEKIGEGNETLSVITSLQQEQPECIEKTVRISPGMLSNFGTSTYVLYVDLTQDEMAKVAPLGLDSGKIKIKIVCE